MEDDGRLAPATRGQWLVVGCVAFLATVPFLHKAYHIDDVLYLHGAYITLKTGDPYAGSVLWDAPDGKPSPLFMTDYNPPLWKLLLAGAIAIWEPNPDRRADAVLAHEWKLHLLESAFVWLGAFGTFQLGRRFTRWPAWSTAMILWSPFFLPGQNLMLEGPLLCFYAWSLEFLFRGMDAGRARWIVLSGALAALAVMTKYSSATLLGALALGAISRRQWKGLLALAPPILTILAWQAWCLIHYGQPHLGAHGFVAPLTTWWVRALTTFRCLGAVLIFTPALFLALQRKGAAAGWWARAAIGLATLAAVVDLAHVEAVARQSFRWSLGASQMSHFLAFTLNGSAMVAAWVGIAYFDARSANAFGRRQFLDGWILLAIAFNVFCVPFHAVRHLLPIGLAMVWRGSIAIEEIGDRWRRGMLIASSALGFSLALADYQFAGLYRQLAEEVIRPRALAGQSVWYAGNWGWVFYANQAGGVPLLAEPENYGLPGIREGDVICRPMVLTWRDFPENLRVRAFEHRQPATDWIFRTVAPGVHYYAVLEWALPWEILIANPGQGGEGAFYRIPPLDDVVIFRIDAVEKE